MKVIEYLREKVKKGTLHMTLIDPAKQEPEQAGEIASSADRFGSDAIMVGGSTGITQENLDATILAIKKGTKLPVIYFPSGAHAISAYSDAIYFMSMLNSRNVKMIIGEQVAASRIVKKLGIEPVSMGYIIIEPGMKVGEVGEANLVKRNDPKSAVAYALAAEFMGMQLVYLESGSGAPAPVPSEIISEVRKNITVPLIVGGGIREPEQAAMVREAGANIIVTGTIVENGDYQAKLKAIIHAVKG
jgi:phosphoglycerol geranylgeranyltransferase